MNPRIFFRGATLVTLDPLCIEHADLLVGEGRVQKKAWRLTPPNDAVILDVRGRMMLPGLVDACVKPLDAFARTLPRTDAGDTGAGHTEESLLCAAFATATEAVRAGVTTVIVTHRSPGFVGGSLARMRDACTSVGLRVIVAYALGDEAGDALTAALAEERSAAATGGGGRTRAMLGVGPVGAVSAAALAEIARLAERHTAPVLAEVTADADVTRLATAGLLTRGGAATVGPAVTTAAAAQLATAGFTLIHTPTADLAAAKTAGALIRFAGHGALGSGGRRSDILEEARIAMARAHGAGEAATPADVVALIAGGQALASRLLGIAVGSFEPGATADFIVLDYRAATPFNEATLPWHIVEGMASAHVQHVMVEGELVLRDRTFTALDARNLLRQTQRGALDLWLRTQTVPFPGLDRPEPAPRPILETRTPQREDAGGSILASGDDEPDIEILPAAASARAAWLLRTVKTDGSADDPARTPAVSVRRLTDPPPAPVRPAPAAVAVPAAVAAGASAPAASQPVTATAPTTAPPAPAPAPATRSKTPPPSPTPPPADFGSGIA